MLKTVFTPEEKQMEGKFPLPFSPGNCRGRGGYGYS